MKVCLNITVILKCVKTQHNSILGFDIGDYDQIISDIIKKLELEYFADQG